MPIQLRTEIMKVRVHTQDFAAISAGAEPAGDVSLTGKLHYQAVGNQSALRESRARQWPHRERIADGYGVGESRRIAQASGDVPTGGRKFAGE